MYEDSYNAPYSQPIQAQAVAKKQPPKSAIIIGAVALVAIAAIIVFLFLGGNTSKYNGTYDLDTVSYLGMEFPAEDFTNEEAYIKIKGDKATLRAEGEDTRTATIKIDGEDVKITDGEDTIKGKYDADEKTITIEMEGIGMTFKKR